jgi:hypothetical protein
MSAAERSVSFRSSSVSVAPPSAPKPCSAVAAAACIATISLRSMSALIALPERR